MSYSFRAASKLGGAFILAVALCVAVVVGLAACGGNEGSTVTTVGTTDTVAGDTATTAGGDTGTSTAAAQIDEALLGKWAITADEAATDFGGTLEFTRDGRMIAVSDDPEEGTVEFAYSADGTNLIITMQGQEQPASTYKIEGDVLTISDAETGDSESYTRVTE